ncbi:MAG TPA: toll/interleukin-1 receptor domain-containing protein [Pyrinomonadaceae bacterium]|nr:toll/interleukin-1 receptor domain-containing protein [Pyrinomonadaceae bacterium]
MPNENDIFVSYAHVDNKPFDNPQGWVDSFAKRLSLRLEQLIGREPAVWRDTRLQGNEYFAGSIGDGVSSTTLLLSVISPRYVNSDWCRGEIKEFCRHASRAGGPAAGNLSRVFKVVKTHVDEAEMPEELQGLLGYHFYDFDERGRPREFRPDDPPNKDQRYWDRLEDLALDIVKALKTFGGGEPREARRGEGAEADPDALPLEKKVYLAETTADVSPERDRIRRELQQRGFYVLPDRELPRGAAEFERKVAEHLTRCALSVQLVGSTYGLIPEGEEERSIIRMQEELAARRASEDASFSRLIWMPPGLEPQGNRHRAFVEALHTGLGAGAELLQTSVEDLKMRVVEKLTRRAEAAARPSPPADNGESGGPRAVYLICDNRDVGDVMPIEDYLFNQGFEVINSAVVSESDDAAQAHRESLLYCDAALIYYGNANPMWLRSKLWDLQKARGWGRTSPLSAKAVVVGAPQTTEKQRFRTHEVPLVIQNFEGSPEALEPFVEAVRTAEGGPR